VRVLLVHDYGTATGGAELQMLALRDGLRARGHDVRLFASRARHVPSEVVADHTCYGTTGRLQVLTQTVNPSAVRQLARVLREFRPDVVHVRMMLWQLSPAILPLLRGVPCLYQAAVYKAVCPRGTKLLPDGTACRDRAGTACLRNGCLTVQSWVPLMLQRALWNRWRGVFDRVVALSTVMRERLEAEGVAPVRVVHNGVPERAARPPLAGPPLAAYAGRLAPEKGVDVLLRAFARAAPSAGDARLLVLGDGPERERLTALAGALGVAGRVEFAGHLTRAAMERRLDAAWVQAVPSLWEEPFGNVTTEAMMRGTAVVASAVGGQRDIVDAPDAGFLVPPADDAALADALARLLGDRAAAERVGAAGRARALARFSEAACLDRFEALYDEIIRDRREARAARAAAARQAPAVAAPAEAGA
jgi:glycosyltransferase involved in cell wall biosynthesis